jgi:hypothetical protein
MKNTEKSVLKKPRMGKFQEVKLMLSEGTQTYMPPTKFIKVLVEIH